MADTPGPGGCRSKRTRVADTQAIVPHTYNYAHDEHLRLPRRLVSLPGIGDVDIAQRYRADGRGGTALGFGASVYHSAVVLAFHVAEHAADLVQGRRVLELGAGTGFVSVVAACAGGRVTCTDGDAGLLPLMEENAERNRHLWADEASFAARHYMWGERGALDGPYAVVLAADVAAVPYAHHLDALVQAFQEMTAPDGVAFLAYQPRHGLERKFFHRLRQHMEVEEVPRECLHPDFRDSTPIQLFAIRHRAQAAAP